jgi:hypothetical protein
MMTPKEILALIKKCEEAKKKYPPELKNEIEKIDIQIQNLKARVFKCQR